MKMASKVLMVLGILVALYAVISKYVGVPGMVQGGIKSISFLVAANTLLLLAILAKSEAKG